MSLHTPHDAKEKRDQLIMNQENLTESTALRVTEQQVWQAANSLWVKKIDPSANKIREVLGHRGSFRTIQTYLDSWRKQVWDQPAVDDPLWQELVKMRKKNELQANSTALKKIHEIQQECSYKITLAQELQIAAEQQREALGKQLQGAQQELAKLIDEHQALYNRFNEEQKSRDVAEQLNQSLEKELHQTRLQTEKQLNAHSKDYEKNITALNLQIAQSQKQFDDKYDELAKIHDEVKQVLGGQITDLRLKNQELSMDIEQTKIKEPVTLAEIETLKSQNIKSLAEIKQYQNEQQVHMDIQHGYEKELAIMQEKLKQSQLHVDELKHDNNELQKQLLNYSVKLGQLEEKIATLKYRTKEEADI